MISSSIWIFSYTSAMSTLIRTLSFIPLLAATIGSIALGRDTQRSLLPSEILRFTGDNDMPFNNDDNYTSGVRLDYMKRWQRDHYWGMSLTQEIYTPSTNGELPPLGEHPYAGHLALGFAYISRGDSFGTTTELQVGITGQSSLAENSQHFIHKAGRLNQWNGWDNQVPSELTLQLSSRQEFDIEMWCTQTQSGLESDSSFSIEEAVGTAEISMGLGYTLRFGHNLPPSQRRVGCHRANYALSSLKSRNYRPEEYSLYFLTGVHAAYVAHDYSVDGGVFKRFDSSATRVPWQFEWQVGIGAQYQGVSFFLGGVLQSKRFDDQDGVDNYATFSIAWQW